MSTKTMAPLASRRGCLLSLVAIFVILALLAACGAPPAVRSYAAARRLQANLERVQGIAEASGLRALLTRQDAFVIVRETREDLDTLHQDSRYLLPIATRMGWLPIIGVATPIRGESPP